MYINLPFIYLNSLIGTNHLLLVETACGVEPLKVSSRALKCFPCNSSPQSLLCLLITRVFSSRNVTYNKGGRNTSKWMMVAAAVAVVFVIVVIFVLIVFLQYMYLLT
jgi:hypothetical protein